MSFSLPRLLSKIQSIITLDTANNNLVLANSLVFPDGTRQTTAGVAVDAVARNTANGANSLAQSAYDQANVSIGVDATQNTNIAAVNQFAQSAYNTANGKISAVSQDTAPSLGGALDVQNHPIWGGNYNGNQLILPVGSGATLASYREGGVNLSASTDGGTTSNTWNFNSTGQIRFPDGTYQNTAFNGSSADAYARATANLAIGTNDTQNTRIQSVETINANQNTAITLLQGVNDGQNSTISIIQSVNDTQNTRLTTVEFTAQFARDTANNAVANTNALVGVNDTQNTRIQSVETNNNIQNTAIGIIQNVDLWQNTQISYIQSIDTTQNSNIALLQSYVTSANANIALLQSYVTSANANIAFLQSINNTQNTNITAVNNFAQGAYNTANGAFTKANNALANATGTFAGDLTITGNTVINGNVTVTNITGSNPNTQIIAGAYTTTFDNAGKLTLPGVIVFADGSSQNTAFTGNGVDSFARSTVNAVSQYATSAYNQANVTIGVDATQNTRLDGIEGTNVTQNTRISSIETINSNQNTSISIIQGVDDTQNTRLDGIEGTNVTQNTRISSIETINTNQNTSISIIQGVNLTQNNRLDGLEGVNAVQNTNITSVNQFAQSGYDKANSANVLAQSAYDLAFTKFDANGGTIHGSILVQGDVNATGNITYSGSVTSQTITGNTGQFFGYAANGFNALYAGLPTGYAKLPNEVTEFAAANNSYVQINFQNENGGTAATTDWVATADNGTDTTNYVDLGIAGSGYDNTNPNNSLGSSLFPNDSYLYAQGTDSSTLGGNLVIGAATTGKVLKVLGGGVNASNVVATFSGNNISLSVPLVFADSTSMSSAPATIEYSIAAYNKANTVSSNTIYTQGVDRAQNTAIGNLQGTALSTNNAISIIQGVDIWQNTAITVLQGANDTQNTRLDGIEGTNAAQNTTISIIQGVDLTQNTRLNSIETINSNQNTTISIIQGVDATQNTRLDGIEGVNSSQNTNITAVNNYAASAYNTANTNATNITYVNQYAASAYATANTNATNITAVNGYATSAYNQANVTAGGLVTANANIAVIQGVDLWQNTQITYVNQFAQSAYNKANTGVSSSNTFVTINANSTLINASSNNDTLTIMPGSYITFATDSVSKKVTISSNVIPVTIPTLAPSRTSFVAASAQSSIAITHTVPYVYVSVNGITVDPSEYTANGSYIVLTTPLRIGDVVDVTGYATGTSTVTAIKGDKGDVGSFTSNTVLYATDLFSTGNVSASYDIYAGSVSLNNTYNKTNYLQGVANTQNTNTTAVNNFAQFGYNQANSAFNAANTAAANTVYTQGVDASQNAAISVIQGVDTWQNNQITLVNQFAQSAYNNSNTKFNTSGGNITGPVTISGNNSLTVTGNLIVTGTTLTSCTSTFITSDPMLYLGVGNYLSDIVDIGFAAHYNDGVANAHTGLVRDSGTKEYYFFKGYTPEVDANNDINIADASFQTANVNASYFKGNVIGTSTNTVNAFVSTSLGVGTPASGVSGEIRAANNILSFYTSDKQFKENIVDIPDALNKVEAIGGKLFDWTDSYLNNHGGVDEYYVRKNDFGVIAQDVQAVFPVAVRNKPDGSLAVDYEKLSALAFAAIKELKKEIDELKGKK